MRIGSTQGDLLLSVRWDDSARLWDLRSLEHPATELLAEAVADRALTPEAAMRATVR